MFPEGGVPKFKIVKISNLSQLGLRGEGVAQNFPQIQKRPNCLGWGGGGRESYGIFLLFVTFFLWLPKSNPSNLISISYDFLPTKVALHFCNAIHQIQNCLRLNIGKVVHLPRPLHCLNLATWCYSVSPILKVLLKTICLLIKIECWYLVVIYLSRL